jgi:spore germination cell wall hydrolase CwlJ-like protein
MTNRTLAIIGCSLLAVLLIRQEVRMDMLEEKLDDIIHVKEQIRWTRNDLDCLTRNVYYEARGEDHRGKIAVAHVTINRLKAGYWGDTICKVVYARGQFSWTLSKRLPKPDAQAWANAEEIALRVLAGQRVRGLSQSLFYHAIYIKDPHWADPQHEVGQIGQHIFYNRAKNSNIKI